MIVRRIYQILAITPLVILVLALLFRSTLYWSIPVADGEPIGGGDILEGILFIILLASCLLSISFAIFISIIPKIRNNSYSIRLLIIAIVVPLVFWFIHPFVPRLV